MELAIPLVTLGGMYVLANKEKKESFVTNRELHKNSGENHARVHPQQRLKPTNFPQQPQRVPNEPIAGQILFTINL